MRIAILGRADYITLQRHAENLRKLGHEVTVVSVQQGNPNRTYNEEIVKIPRRLHRFGVQYLAATWSVWHKVRSMRPEIIDFHGASTYGLYALLPWELPIVLTIYGPDIYIHARKYKPIRRLIAKALNKANGIWGSRAVIGYVREYVGMDISDRVWVNSWGISKNVILKDAASRRKSIREEFNTPNEARVVLHSRRMHPFWRIDVVVEAIPEVLKKHPNTEFWFAYPAPGNSVEERYLIQLKERLERLDCASSARWLGYSPHEQMISIMHASDVYVCIGENDMLASSIQEALITGLVPILVDLDSYREIIKHKKNGFYLEDVTPAQLSQTIEFVLDHFDVLSPTIATANHKLFDDSHDQEASTRWLVERYQEAIASRSESRA